jgi:hypothetical protein
MADGTVDTSIYPKANQNSLVETLGQVQNLQNARETNKLLQQQQTQGQISIDQSKIDLAHQQYGRLSQFLGSLAQDPRVGTAEGHQILLDATQQAVDQGWITPDVAKVEIANMPQDPTKIPQYLQSLNTRVLGAQEQFGQIYGTPTTYNNGNQQIPATVSPITGVRPIGAPIQTQTSPSERAELVQTTDAQGRTVMVPKGQFLSKAGVNPLTAVPETAPQGQENRLVPPPMPVQRGNLPPVQTQQAPAVGVVTSPPAGEIEAQTRSAAASSDRLSEDTARERTYQQDVIPLMKAKDALEALGTTGTGPGTEQINEVKSFLTSMGIISPQDEVKNFDEARKYLVQFARGAGDTGTNDKLAAAFAGNPSLGISNAASVDVVKTALSLRRLQNAQVRAFAASGESPANYAKWSTEFNSQQDPIAYGFDMLDGAKRQKYFKGLNEADKQKFLKSLKTATELGLVAPPSVNSGQQ